MPARLVTRVAAFACACVTISTAAHAQNFPPVQVAPPGETGRRITDDGLFGNYYPAKSQAPGVLLLGGSIGGLAPPTNDAAKALQAEGFSVLHLSYFRAPGQNPRLELIPLEYFDTALAWLRRQPEVDPARIIMAGGSKGAEAALLIAVRHPELKAVIAALPSSVVWPGIVWEGSAQPIASSWTEHGKPLPHVPHVPFDATRGGTMAGNYAKSLEAMPQHPEAIIPVERITAPILLICGEQDEISPSCPMARQIQDRLRRHGRPAATLLAYANGGHRAFGPPMAAGDPRATKELNEILADSWKNTLAFLKATIAAAQRNFPPVQVDPPGPSGRRITDDGLLANYFPAKPASPAVLLLGGSEGGLPRPTNDVAKALQAEGFSVLHLSYFRGPGQNPRAELLPLEYFDTALAWLRRQPEVDPARMGIAGVSKGGEAALLVATRHPELKAVIGAVPSSVVWPGIVMEAITGPIGSSWTEHGKPLPHLPHVPYDASKGGTMAENYAKSLEALPQHPEALIPVERIRGRILLVCGEQDQAWPSCPMSRQIQNRLREHRRPEATLLAYGNAGHRIFGPPLPLDHPRFNKELNDVLADSWKNTLAFLKAELSATPVKKSP